MAHFGYCDLAVIPVRREPSDRSEMSTQLLFGDLVEVHEQNGSWLSVRNLSDDYTGFVDAKQLRPLEESEVLRLQSLPLFVNRGLFSDQAGWKGGRLQLPAGCSFYGMQNMLFNFGQRQYSFDGMIVPYSFADTDSLLMTAMNYLNCPYLWGGKTYMGLDCSGLTQVVFKQHGISLLRDAAQQATQGELINFLSDSLPGDLAFFDNSEGRIIHVGILLDLQRILHCSGRVRIDSIDHQGIFNQDLNKYTHNLRLIRRVIQPQA